MREDSIWTPILVVCSRESHWVENSVQTVLSNSGRQWERWIAPFGLSRSGVAHLAHLLWIWPWPTGWHPSSRSVLRVGSEGESKQDLFGRHLGRLKWFSNRNQRSMTHLVIKDCVLVYPTPGIISWKTYQVGWHHQTNVYIKGFEWIYLDDFKMEVDLTKAGYSTTNEASYIKSFGLEMQLQFVTTNEFGYDQYVLQRCKKFLDFNIMITVTSFCHTELEKIKWTSACLRLVAHGLSVIDNVEREMNVQSINFVIKLFMWMTNMTMTRKAQQTAVQEAEH